VQVRRVCFVGVRTAHFDATVACIRDVLGFEQAFANSGWAGFMLGSGQRDLLEVFSDGEHDERLFPASAVPSGVVIAFAVDDVVGARAELAAAGVELIGDVVWAEELFRNPQHAGYGWCFFKMPDGNVYALQQDGLATSPG
jgi:catechol 2,3-dioxygenase-like lactoylglutathione lyase family enzyme